VWREETGNASGGGSICVDAQEKGNRAEILSDAPWKERDYKGKEESSATLERGERIVPEKMTVP